MASSTLPAPTSQDIEQALAKIDDDDIKQEAKTMKQELDKLTAVEKEKALSHL